jgi:hypothetical protein
MKIDINEKQHVCDACGNSFVSNIAAELNTNTDFDEVKLKNSRENLTNSVRSNDLNAILHFSRDILGMIPKDFTGSYYNAYASSKLVSPKALHRFLDNHSVEATKEEIEKVIMHASKHTDLREQVHIDGFVDAINPSLLPLVKRIFEERIQLEDNYASIPRDVFICHRSTDYHVAKSVMESLEEDGIAF